MFKEALTCAGALALGNFIWQALTAHAWMVATERSYFGLVALMIFCWVYRERLKYN